MQVGFVPISEYQTALTDQDDDLLMAAIAGRTDTPRQTAAAEFIRRHSAYVLKICMTRLKNQAEAEEASQDVFLSIWRNADKWRPGGAKVTTWLYRIAANRCIDILRRRRPSETLDDIPEPMDEADNAEQIQQLADRNRLIGAAMGALNQNQRRAIELVYYEGMNQREAAELMGLTLAALESVLRRARKQLHHELAERKTHLLSV